MRTLATLLMSVIFVTSAVYGRQVPVVPAVPARIITAPDGSSITIAGSDDNDDEERPRPKGGAADAEKDAAKGKSDKPKEDPRIKKIAQLQHDRRPSAILKAWAEPLPVVSTEVELFGPPAPAEADAVDAEMACLRHLVTLGQWGRVKAVLHGYPEDIAKAGYKQIVKSLASEPPFLGGQQIPPQFRERNRMSVDDLLGLAAAAPKGQDKETVAGFAGILRSAIGGGIVPEIALARLKIDADRPEGGALTHRQLAQILLAADLEADAGAFLPSVESALEYKDLEALNLLARHFLALHNKERKGPSLERAWAATQAILATSGAKEEKEEALKRAVELAPRVKEELGNTWLEKSFTDKPERGQEILATLGGHVASGFVQNMRNQDARHKALQLQKTAVDALVKAAPTRANEWRSTLTLLAANWLKEAEYAQQFSRSVSSGPSMRRDQWGNIFYQQDFDSEGAYYNRGNNMPSPVEAADVLATRPDGPWLQYVDPAIKPKLAMTVAQLHLKVNEDAKAFPHIEELAKTHPEKAKDLVNEFLKVWTRNHNPNANRGYTNPYMFMYGFDMRSNSIPLTRSKQERNLAELSEWAERLRKLPIGDPDEDLLAKAFTNCHSSAEVYRIETIEKVFGPLDKLKSKTLSGLTEQMRSNLAGLWRTPKTQADAKTKRKQKDIEGEVTRGYAVAQRVLDQGLAKAPNEWSLVLAKAALAHDEANFRHEVDKSGEYAPRIVAAMELFRQAHELYRKQAAGQSEDDENIRVYETWFCAALGAVDVNQLNDEKLPDMKQFPAIKAALASFPGAAAERHQAKFASQLFSKMSSVAPSCKFRYLKGGFEVVGDHKAAHEAKKVYDYYKDLVKEIKLVAQVDGPAAVGHGKPFGVFVNLEHTRAIERESGGFARYLQNQNSTPYFSYNYGRPTADYRDKFQSVVTEAFKDNFEVLSVTFQTDKTGSKPMREDDWRFTSYAYLLLKARGPQVDKLPPLRLDLDFLDTSGYVILPIESPAVPIDASPKEPPARPVRDLKMTQVLDERKADQGILTVEIKASGTGLVGDLTQMLDLNVAGLKIDKIDYPGVSVAKFHDEADPIAPLSEGNGMITYKATGDALPANFKFPEIKVPTKEVVYQKYNDADLVAAQPQMALGLGVEQPKRGWLWYAIPTGVVGLILLGVLAWLLMRQPDQVATGPRVPENLTPFVLLDMLTRVERANGFAPDRKAQLRATIETVERHYFAATGADAPPDLRRIAEEWVARG